MKRFQTPARMIYEKPFPLSNPARTRASTRTTQLSRHLTPFGIRLVVFIYVELFFYGSFIFIAIAFVAEWERVRERKSSGDEKLQNFLREMVFHVCLVSLIISLKWRAFFPHRFKWIQSFSLLSSYAKRLIVLLWTERQALESRPGRAGLFISILSKHAQ